MLLFSSFRLHLVLFLQLAGSASFPLLQSMSWLAEKSSKSASNSVLSTTLWVKRRNSAVTKRRMCKLPANLLARPVLAQGSLSTQKICQSTKLIPTTIKATSLIPLTLHRYHWVLGHKSPTGSAPHQCIQLAIIGLRWKLTLQPGDILKSRYSSSSHFWLLGWALFIFPPPAEPSHSEISSRH